MHNRIKKLVKVSALVLPLSLAVGCATTGDLEKVRAMANDAKAAADSAAATASEAKTMAAQANQKADEARSCCEELRAGQERMFKRSMRK